MYTTKLLKLLTKHFNLLECDYDVVTHAINDFGGVFEYLEDLEQYLTTKEEKKALECIKKELNNGD